MTAMTSFQELADIISRIKVLLSGDCTHSVWSALTQHRPLFLYSTFVLGSG